MIEFAAAALAVLIALPATVAGTRPSWLLPLAAGPAAGAAGWAILPAPHGPLLQLAATVSLLLPVTVFVLCLTRRSIPQNLTETAAACGASPLQTLLHARIRPALPGLAATLAIAFILSLGIAPLLAPLAVRP
jgi:ABC-type spermidine/putrescine transport system permease subunit II